MREQLRSIYDCLIVIGVAGTVRLKDLIDFVRQSTKAEDWPVLITLGGVVEHDVENDLDTRPMEWFHAWDEDMPIMVGSVSAWVQFDNLPRL